MNSLTPHHDGSPLYVSDREPSLGDTVYVRLRVPSGYGPLTSVRTRSNPDHEPEWTDATPVGEIGGWCWWEAPIRVRNHRHGYRWLLQHASGFVEWLNQTGMHNIEVLDAEDFALVSQPASPEWLTDAVMYQVFIDRFARSARADTRSTPEWAMAAGWSDAVDPVMPGRSQQFYGGDLDGVVDNLDHLERLGVNLLYLTPVFPGASNHRYDASSFDRIDPLLGGEAAFARLVTAAHQRGIRVIGDLTCNHSGYRHEWFQSAHRNPGAPEESFYYFTDPGNTKYDSWLGTPTLPKLNWRSTDLRHRFIDGPDSVAAKWLQPPYGLDGWRIDVANMTGRHGDVDFNADVRALLRDTATESNLDAIVLAEITNDATDDLQGDGWHGAMSYAAFTRPLWGWLSEPRHDPYIDSEGVERTVPWFFGQPLGGIPRYTARQFMQSFERFNSSIPWSIRLGNMLMLDSHDTARFATNAAPGTIPVAVGLAMTLPGLPMVYAGDEFGLVGTDGEVSRTPIPWGQVADPEVADRIDLYRNLIALRREHRVLGTGGLRWIHADDDTLVFIRESAEESILVLASRARTNVELASSSIPRTRPDWIVGDATVAPTRHGSFLLTTTGPTFTAWGLPGVATALSALGSLDSLP